MKLRAISADWLRRRFADRPAPAAAVREAPPGMTDPIAAAVLVPIVLRPAGLTVLLTRRSTQLPDHAGQVSFPGGRCEPQDATPVVTALRETREEVGIEAERIEVLGLLPDYFTATGFRVTPVVGLVAPPFALCPAADEVAQVFESPLSFLLDAANYRRAELEYQGRRRSYWAVPWEEHFIWGATAGMLVSLRESLLGE